MAANYPDMIPTLIGVMLSCPFPPPATTTFPPANLIVLGHHYFTSATTPVFNLDTSQHEDGIIITKKIAQMSAPAGSIVGQNNDGNGAVDWLYLSAEYGTTGGYSGVYRVDTAGGQPPATCQGQQSSFTVPYSAAYYFYGS
jgi:Protein of unknown function (DUF3455)